jgi:hypothetical protein
MPKRKQKPQRPVPALPQPSPTELNRIARPSECEHLSGHSWDTILRNWPELVVRVSPRISGMRVGHALHLRAASNTNN